MRASWAQYTKGAFPKRSQTFVADLQFKTARKAETLRIIKINAASHTESAGALSGAA